MNDVQRAIRKLGRRHTVPRLVYRFVSGRPLSGKDGHPYLSRGAGRLAGWQRQVIRLSVPTAATLAAMYPHETGSAIGSAALVVSWRAGRRLKMRRFNREYVEPTLAALAPALGRDTGQIRLHVDPSLGTLRKRLARPLSPAEEAVRAWYGQHVEPALLWLPGHAQRSVWAVQRWARPVTRHLDVFRRPAEPDAGPRIELVADTPYLTREQRQLMSSIVNAKIPAGELVESWQQVGRHVTATWTVRKRPPTAVGVDQLLEYFPTEDARFYIGQAAGDRPVVLDLDDDAPHIALSAGTGAGESAPQLPSAEQYAAAAR